MTLDEFIGQAEPFVGHPLNDETCLIIRCPRVLKRWCSNRHQDTTWPLWSLGCLGGGRAQVWCFKKVLHHKPDSYQDTAGYVCTNNVVFFFSHNEQKEDSLYSYLHRIWVPRHLLPLPSPETIRELFK